MTDPEGVTYGLSDPVFYDDGHSPDWVHGTVQAFISFGVRIVPDGGGSPALIQPPLVHVHKPANPPDR